MVSATTTWGVILPHGSSMMRGELLPLNQWRGGTRPHCRKRLGIFLRNFLRLGLASGLIRMASSIWTRTVSFVCRSSRHWRRMNPQKNRKPFTLVSRKQIEKILYDDGFRNHNGNKLSHATMAHIIRNPKYKGYFCGNKVGTEDMFTKKMVFKPESEGVMFKDECIVPAI